MTEDLTNCDCDSNSNSDSDFEDESYYEIKSFADKFQQISIYLLLIFIIFVFFSFLYIYQNYFHNFQHF